MDAACCTLRDTRLDVSHLHVAMCVFCGKAWEEAKEHCSGIARHYFQRADEGWSIVARKWYGPELRSAGPGSPSVPFFESDPAFVDLIDCPRIVEVCEHILIGRPDGTEYSRIPRKDRDAGDVDFWQVNRGVVRCLGGGPRTYPSDMDGAGYTYWCEH